MTLDSLSAGQYIADTSLDYASAGKITDPVVHGLSVIVTGYDVTATCSARTPGVSNPTFHWTLKDRDVAGMTSSGRYIVSGVTRADNDLYRFSSTVTVQRILPSESGQCSVVNGPSYLSDLLKFYIPSRQLRSSSDTLLLRIPSFHLKSFG